MKLVDPERDLFVDYTQKDRLRQKATNSVNYTIIKEILDNAADEVESNQSNYIEIALDGEIFSVLNKGTINEKAIKAITSFKTLYSKKYKYKRISRGMVGHGLKLAIMLSYQEDESNVFKIHTGGKLYKIYLNNRTPKKPDEVLKVVTEETSVDKDFTKIEVKLSKIRGSRYFLVNYFFEKDFKDFVYCFIAGNPHISFKLKVDGKEELFEKTAGKKAITKKADINAYTLDEFKDFIGREKEHLLDRISKNAFKELFRDFNIPFKKMTQFKFMNIKQLYEFIKENAEKIKMPLFGRKAIERRLGSVFENFVSCGYKSYQSDSLSSEIVLFKTTTKIESYRYGNLIAIVNGTYFTSALIGSKIEEKLENEDLFVLLMCYGTNLEITGNNKEKFSVPEEINKIVEQLYSEFKRGQKLSKSEKGHYSWLKRVQQYKQIIRTKSRSELLQTLHPEIDKDVIKHTIEIKHVFLSDCMNIIYPIVERFGPISIRTAYYHVLSHQIIEKGSYDKFDKVLTEARKEGLISWRIFMDDSKPYIPDGYAISLDEDVLEYIETRISISLVEPHSFDIWERLKVRIEVWVEKTALFPFIQDITRKYNIFLQSLRGYSSVTKAKEGIERIKNYLKKGYKVRILYIGDFDPAGWNISRVLEEEYFKKEISDNRFSLERLALNFEQICSDESDSFLVSRDPLPISEKDKNAKRFRQIFEKKFQEKGIPFGGYEVEAIRPEKLRELLENAIRASIEHEDCFKSVQDWLREFSEAKNEIVTELKKIIKNLKGSKKES